MITVHVLDERPERDPREYDWSVPDGTTLHELLVYANASLEETLEIANDIGVLKDDYELHHNETLIITRVAV